MSRLTGAVINVYSEGTLAIEQGARGVAAIPLLLDWYNDDEIVTFHAGDDAQLVLAHTLDELIYLRELMKGASTALVYPLYSGGAKAKANVVSGFTATAAKQGSRGNSIKITVEASGDMWLVKTWLDTDVIDSQTVDNLSELEGNELVVFSGEGEAAAATVSLTGGTDGTEGSGVWDKFLAKLKTEEYQTIAYIGDDETVKSKIAAYVKTEREDEDKFIQACMGSKQADHEGIISFANGVILEDGTELDANEVSAWLAGATAGAAVTESLTYTVYPNAVGVTEKLTKSQQLKYKKQGLGCFIPNNGKVKVESDINTLVTYTTLKQKDFSKNRVLRVVDGICTDIKTVFDSSYAGYESNNTDGRNHFKASICEYMTELQKQGAVENFVSDDVVVSAGKDKDQVMVELRVQPIDSMEKADITVKVR